MVVSFVASDVPDWTLRGTEHEGASKAIAAQYLAERLEWAIAQKQIDAEQLRKRLPPYVVAAIAHITRPFEAPAVDDVGDAAG